MLISHFFAFREGRETSRVSVYLKFENYTDAHTLWYLCHHHHINIDRIDLIVGLHWH
jgi:hypothetical protein